MSEIKRLLTDRDFRSFKPYIDAGYSNPPKSNVSARWKILRDILPGYKEGVVEIEENLPANDGTGGNRIYNYSINLLIHGKEIFYYTLKLRKYNKIDEDTWEPYYSQLDSFNTSKKYADFENSFREAYKANLIQADLFQIVVFGDGCGISVTPPKHQQILDTYLQNKDAKSILVWLQSANTEKQLYALKGLKFLTISGYRPTLEQVRLIQLISQKEGTVNVCSGCIFYSDTIKNVIAEIASWNVGNGMYEKRSGNSNNLIYSLTALVLISLLSFIFLRRRTKTGVAQS